MSNEVVIRSGKTYRLGDQEVVVRDTDPPVIFHDVVVENRLVNGTIYLSLANLTVDGNNAPELTIASRHRMSIVSAQILRDMLTGLIEAATKPVDQSKAN